MKKNVVLIGMPGAGKSTVGVVLAKNLGYSFIDSDLLIQEYAGKLLHNIIEEKGLDGFEEIENKVNASISTFSSVIATDGSDNIWKRSYGTFKRNRNGSLSFTSLRRNRAPSR